LWGRGEEIQSGAFPIVGGVLGMGEWKVEECFGARRGFERGSCLARGRGGRRRSGRRRRRGRAVMRDVGDGGGVVGGSWS